LPKQKALYQIKIFLQEKFYSVPQNFNFSNSLDSLFFSAIISKYVGAGLPCPYSAFLRKRGKNEPRTFKTFIFVGAGYLRFEQKEGAG